MRHILNNANLAGFANRVVLATLGADAWKFSIPSAEYVAAAAANIQVAGKKTTKIALSSSRRFGVTPQPTVR